jgi:hypothetical protein
MVMEVYFFCVPMLFLAILLQGLRLRMSIVHGPLCMVGRGLEPLARVWSVNALQHPRRVPTQFAFALEIASNWKCSAGIVLGRVRDILLHADILSQAPVAIFCLMSS